MSTLIIPVAGQSSRFPNMRPKWLLTMPSGRLMFEESVAGLALQKYDRIILTCLRKHLDGAASYERILSTARKNVSEKIEIIVLDEATRSHAETVFETLQRGKVSGGFFLKDCDNYFTCEYLEGNTISIVNLRDVDLIDAKNKSYVQLDSHGYVKNIVEKNVISEQFCCGGYSFSSADEFCTYYLKLYRGVSQPDSEIYVSHVIHSMLLDGIQFTTSACKAYVDWGTLREYRHATKQFLTVFCDVDGVLLKNGSKFVEGGWRTECIKKNVLELSRLQKSGRLYLIVTTSRPKSEEEYVRAQLQKFDLVPDVFISGLPHSKRVLVNDFSMTNPYPTSIAINLTRDSELLGEHLTHLVE